MSDYFPLRPEGVGTLEIEAFPSYFYRLAELHSLTMFTLSYHLSSWWGRRTGTPFKLPGDWLSDSRGLPLCGYNDAVKTNVDVVSIAVGQPDIYRTTLLPLQGIADRICHGALKTGRAWCPACMREAVDTNATHYDRLLWFLIAIERCPTHRLRLVTHCPSCGNYQRIFSSSGITRCCKCHASLVPPVSEWVVQLEPSFGENDCCQLVEAIANGGLREAVPNSFSIFSEELSGFLAPLIAGRRRMGALTTGGPMTWKGHKPPTLVTMLKRCHLSGIGIVDVLTDPLGAARVAGELIFRKHRVGTIGRPRHSAEAAQFVREHILHELDEGPEIELVPLAALARHLGVSTGFIRYHEPELCVQYGERIRVQNCTLYARKMSTVAKWLRSGVLNRYFGSWGGGKKALVRHVCEVHGIGKNVARRMVSCAIMESQVAKRAKERRSQSPPQGI